MNRDGRRPRLLHPETDDVQGEEVRRDRAEPGHRPGRDCEAGDVAEELEDLVADVMEEARP